MMEKKGLGIATLLLPALAVIVLVWSGIEDTDVIKVSVLGVALSIAVVFWFLGKHDKGDLRTRQSSIVLSVIVGLLTGALSSLMTVALMLFKDIKHGHVFPDYPPELMLAMLERLPPWTLAGGLIGFSIALLVGLFKDLAGRKP